MEVINRDLLLKHLDEVLQTAKEFKRKKRRFLKTEFKNKERADDLAGVIALVKAEPTAEPCTGCMNYDCKWRHCAPPEQKPINWGVLDNGVSNE